MPSQRKQQFAANPSTPRTYTVFFRQEENDIFTAHIPAFDIVTEGRTLDEAKEMAEDAVAGWIEAAHELGKPIPDDVRTAQVEAG